MQPAKKKMTALDEALGRSRGGFSSKLHIAVDALGNPLRFTLTQGQRSDVTQAPALLDSYQPAAVVGDKAYDCDALIAIIEARGAEVVIPSRRNRKEKREIDTNLYKDRNKIERFINRLKHYRRVATRYDKTARNYLAFVYVASINILLL